MSEPPRRRTILAVDDHELVRVGLRQVIVQHFADRFDVAEAPSLEEALAYLQRLGRDVFLLLLDLNLGDTRGLAGLRLLKKRYPHLPVAVVSGTHDARVREEALAQGAVGYFSKTGDNGDLQGLLDTIHRVDANADVHAGPVPVDPAALPLGAPDAIARYKALRPGVRLTERQIQVLELVLGGMDNQAIARETGLALGSVKNCVSSIFLDFNVRSRPELFQLFS